MLDGPLLPRALGLDLWYARIPEEGVYARALAGMRGSIGVWTGFGVTSDVHEYDVLCTSPRLPVTNVTLKRRPWGFGRTWLGSNI